MILLQYLIASTRKEWLICSLTWPFRSSCLQLDVLPENFNIRNIDYAPVDKKFDEMRNSSKGFSAGLHTESGSQQVKILIRNT